MCECVDAMLLLVMQIQGDCQLLLEVKQRSTQLLKADYERSVVVLDNLHVILSRLKKQRGSRRTLRCPNFPMESSFKCTGISN